MSVKQGASQGKLFHAVEQPTVGQAAVCQSRALLCILSSAKFAAAMHAGFRPGCSRQTKELPRAVSRCNATCPRENRSELNQCVLNEASSQDRPQALQLDRGQGSPLQLCFDWRRLEAASAPGMPPHPPERARDELLLDLLQEYAEPQNTVLTQIDFLNTQELRPPAP